MDTYACEQRKSDLAHRESFERREFPSELSKVRPRRVFCDIRRPCSVFVPLDSLEKAMYYCDNQLFELCYVRVDLCADLGDEGCSKFSVRYRHGLDCSALTRRR